MKELEDKLKETSQVPDHILQYSAVEDNSKPRMYLVSLINILMSFQPNYNDYSSRLGPPVKTNELADFEGESLSLHALMRIMLRLECASHILLWSLVDPASGAPLSVDIVELPRLHLTFKKKPSPDGKVHYMCMEQSGCHIAPVSDITKYSHLIDGLPRCILLENDDNEVFVMQPAQAKPVLVKVKGMKRSFRLAVDLSNKEWLINTGEAAYFTFPVHSSGTFMSSKSVSSTLYLFLMRLFTRKYKEAFRLIDSCVCDAVLTPQEKQILEVINKNPDDLLVDARSMSPQALFCHVRL